ncbi:MAG: tRNA pseudouridine(55) synthase TruB [Actinomycetaceae bacterium]|nr:tRNA pseudouridine(55) synthase TruB [Actinomycetaceae bacterium]
MTHSKRRGLTVPRSTVSAPDGLLIVDKPAGVTSHDVVAAIRRLAATRKVGHAGTLDPMATGVLVIGIGKATRLLTHIVGADKAYSATVALGASTDTDDADGQITARAGQPALINDEFTARVDSEIGKLRGNIMQVPTTVSALKIDGQRAHERHRAGEKVEIPARPVTISRLERTGPITPEIARFDDEDVPVSSFGLDVECSSGTYVRAIARDLGQALGTGGFLTSLRRTRVGKWTLEDAVTIDQLVAHVEAENARANADARAEKGVQIGGRAQSEEASDAAANENGDASVGDSQGTSATDPQAAPIPVIPLTRACTQQFASLALEYEEAEALRYGNVTRLRPRTPDGEITACLWNEDVRALVRRKGDRYEPVVVFATGPLD